MSASHRVGTVDLALHGQIATVQLNQPAKFNAMSRSMWGGLKLAFERLQSLDISCVLVQGAGDHFCAGGDISEYPEFRFDTSRLAHFHEVEVWGALDAMLRCNVPVVVALRGNCMGAGLEIASCCDVRVAGQGARFGAPIARLGFPMAPKEAGLVAHAVGENFARAMLLAAEVFPASRLVANGFVTHLADDVDVLNQANLIAQRIAKLAPAAARYNKETLRGAKWMPDANSYAYADSHEHREGITAFVEKRPPVF